MFCSNCGKEITDDMKVCPECGAMKKQTMEVKGAYKAENYVLAAKILLIVGFSFTCLTIMGILLSVAIGGLIMIISSVISLTIISTAFAIAMIEPKVKGKMLYTLVFIINMTLLLGFIIAIA